MNNYVIVHCLRDTIEKGRTMRDVLEINIIGGGCKIVFFVYVVIKLPCTAFLRPWYDYRLKIFKISVIQKLYFIIGHILDGYSERLEQFLRRCSLGQIQQGIYGQTFIMKI